MQVRKSNKTNIVRTVNVQVDNTEVQAQSEWLVLPAVKDEHRCAGVRDAAGAKQYQGPLEPNQKMVDLRQRILPL